jgi:hypothetical protein
LHPANEDAALHTSLSRWNQTQKVFLFKVLPPAARAFTFILCQTSESSYRIAAGVDELHRNGCRAFERVEISTLVN